jgi:hypothetical protein
MVCATGGTIGSASAGSRGGSVEGAVQKLGIGVLDLREAGDERSGGLRGGRLVQVRSRVLDDAHERCNPSAYSSRRRSAAASRLRGVVSVIGRTRQPIRV